MRCRMLSQKAIVSAKKVEIVHAEHWLPFRQACRVIRMVRSLLYYRARSKNDEGMIEAVNAYIAKNFQQGFGLYTIELQTRATTLRKNSAVANLLQT